MELLTGFAVRITASIIAARFAVVTAGTASIITAGIAGTASIIATSVITASTTIARTTAITSTSITIVVFFAAVFAIFVLVLIFDLFPVPFESGVVGIEIFLSRKQIICQLLVNLNGLTSTISNPDNIGAIRSNLAIGAPNYVDFVTGLAGIDNPLGVGIKMSIDFKANPRQTNPLLQTLRVLLKFLVKLSNLQVDIK